MHPGIVHQYVETRKLFEYGAEHGIHFRGVADVGLKSLGMDHGDPTIDDAKVWFCSDEHITFSPRGGRSLPSVGDRVRVWPAHVDPTVAYHERFHLVDGDDVVDEWPIDLRGW